MSEALRDELRELVAGLPHPPRARGRARARWVCRRGPAPGRRRPKRRAGAAKRPPRSVRQRRLPSKPPSAPDGVRPLTLTVVREELGDCTRCKLSGGRKNIVFGVGNPQRRPGVRGRGARARTRTRRASRSSARPGQLLTKMIEAMGFAREDVYICNVIKCRPPDNRNPEPDEVAACEPFLKKQLAAIQPRMIVALGKFAAQSLLPRADPHHPPARQLPQLRGHPGDAHLPPGVPAAHARGQAPGLEPTCRRCWPRWPAWASPPAPAEASARANAPRPATRASAGTRRSSSVAPPRSGMGESVSPAQRSTGRIAPVDAAAPPLDPDQGLAPARAGWPGPGGRARRCGRRSRGCAGCRAAQRLDVQVVAELVQQRVEQPPVAGDLAQHRRAHPDPDHLGWTGCSRRTARRSRSPSTTCQRARAQHLQPRAGSPRRTPPAGPAALAGPLAPPRLVLGGQRLAQRAGAPPAAPRRRAGQRRAGVAGLVLAAQSRRARQRIGDHRRAAQP